MTIENINRYRTVVVNTFKMLKDRKYNLKPYFEKNKLKNINDIKAEFLQTQYKNNNNNYISVVLNDLNDIKTCIYFHNNKIGKSTIKEMRIDVDKNKYKHVIIVSNYEMSPQAKKELALIVKEEMIEKEVFFFRELVFNITEHILVPKHVLLTEKETSEFLQNMGRKIPRIKLTDRMCRHFNGKIDQIFKIYRKSEIIYRIVVA